MSPKLAIVIPAFKLPFFEETLRSIARQTKKDFRVYVGDDASPSDLGAVVERFRGEIDIVYRRFESNQGSYDLVGHWGRCVEMVGDEEWIWFFSDDDTMDLGCVGSFLETIERYPDHDLYHFNVRGIDETGKLLGDSRLADFPELCSAASYCEDRLAYRIQSFAVEFVFRKSKFLAEGGFQRFDLAWGSDVATCIKLGTPRGIRTIPGAYVQWRSSSQNISPNNSRPMVERKLASIVAFFEWLDSFARTRSLKIRAIPLYVYLRRLISFKSPVAASKVLAHVVRLVRLGVAPVGGRAR